MQKIILDTNVIISSLIQKNYPYLIVEYCVETNAIVCISNALLKEYLEVLARLKFSKFADFKTNADFFRKRGSQPKDIRLLPESVREPDMKCGPFFLQTYDAAGIKIQNA